MKKLGKVLMWTGIVLFLLVVLLIVHPLWIGGAVRGVANMVVPKVTGVDFKLGEFALNAYGGQLHVGDVKLWNPTNYTDELAFTLGSLDVKVDMDTVTSKVIVISDITIDGVFASYVKEDGKYNFDVIAENASAESSAETTDGSAPSPAAETAPAEQPVKVVIDRVTIKNVKVKYRMVPIVIPVDIVVEDIGKDSGGATWTEVWEKLLGAVVQALGSTGEQLISAGNSALAIGNDGLTNAVNAVKALDFKGAADSVKSASDGIKSLFKKQK